MMKKRIAIFAGGWSSKILELFINGMSKALTENSFDMFLFLAYPDPSCKDSEFNIFTLPDFSFYDAFVVFSQSIDDGNVLHSLLNKCKETGKPTISCGYEYPGTKCVKVGNAIGMRELCMHLINVHKVSNPIFIAGDKNNGDSNERLEVTKECFENAGFPIDDERIVYTGWDNFVAMRFVENRLEQSKERPDAIICANDGLAMTITLRLEDLGLKVPDDIIVTGYDFLPESQFFYPSIASVDQQFDRYGTRCAQILLEMIDGKKEEEDYCVPTKFISGESCGCLNSRDNNKIRAIAGRNTYRSRLDSSAFDIEMNNLEGIFGSADSLPVLSHKILEYTTKNNTYLGNSIHIMLQPAAFSANPNAIIKENVYYDSLETLISIEDGVVSNSTICPRSLLFPGYNPVGPNHIYSSMPLYDKKLMLGYLVVRDRLEYISNNYLRRFQNRIGMSLLKFKQSHNLNMINNKLNKLVNKDSLTNVKNRTAYEEDIAIFDAEIKQNPMFAVIMFDINNLKQINDELGHKYGDNYIVNSCQLICTVFSHSPVYRIGGDEFVCVPNNSDYINRNRLIEEMQSIMTALAGDATIPREKRVSIAIGLADFDPGKDKRFLDVFKRADSSMYENKEKMKKDMKKDP